MVEQDKAVVVTICTVELEHHLLLAVTPYPRQYRRRREHHQIRHGS